MSIALESLTNDEILDVIDALKKVPEYKDLFAGQDTSRTIHNIADSQRRYYNYGIKIKIANKNFIVYRNYNECYDDAVRILMDYFKTEAINKTYLTKSLKKGDISEYQNYIFNVPDTIKRKIKNAIEDEVCKKDEDLCEELLDLIDQGLYYDALVLKGKIYSKDNFFKIFGKYIDYEVMAKEVLRNYGIEAVFDKYYYTNKNMIVIPQ
jgi:hypothetical protein